MDNQSDGEEPWKLHVLAEVAAHFYDEFQRTKKGKSKIVPEEEETVKSFFDVAVPRKARSSLNGGASTSSSSSSSLLLDLNKKVKTTKTPRKPFRFRLCSSRSEKIKTKNPRSPRRFESTSSNPSSQSCVTEQRGRKRRALEEKKRCSGGAKKAKVVHLSWRGREIPRSLVNMMRGMNVFEEPKLIFEKGLFATDVNPGESRLSMTITQIIRNDFLTPEEARILEEDIKNVNKVGFGAVLVDQRGEKWGVFLKRWETQGQGTWIYSLTCGWNDLVAANGLKEDDGISVWTFRWRGLLCFALVPPPQKGQSRSASSVTQ